MGKTGFGMGSTYWKGQYFGRRIMIRAGTAEVTGSLVTATEPTDLIDTNLIKGNVVIHNRVGKVFVKLGTGASDTSHTYKLNPDAVLEVNNYVGPITAIMEAGTGYVDVTVWG